MRRIGVHTSIAGGIGLSLVRAHALGCNTLQIFSHNPRGWKTQGIGAEAACEFRRLRADLGLSPVFVHSSYLINLASSDPALARRSVEMTVHELNTADEIGAEYVVIHTGSASADEPSAARGRAIDRLGEVAGSGNWKAGLLLENTAGERGDITSGIEEIAEILDRVRGGLISGMCLDTCHAFAAGYDIGSADGITGISGKISSLMGRDRLKLIHVNDSRGPLGCRVDRHEHIGMGKIGGKDRKSVV